MGRMKRLLAALLVTTMLLGNNGISYAAEVSGGTDEVTQEIAAEETESEAETDAAPESDQNEAQDTSVENSASDSGQEITEAVEEDGQEVTEEAAEGEQATEEAAEDEEEAAGDGTSLDASEEGQTTEVSDDEAEEPGSQNGDQEEDASAADTENETAQEGMTESSETAATEESAAPEEEVFEAGEFVYPGEDYGKDYTVRLSYDEAARIPAGAELRVREIEKGTDEYDSYLQGTQDAMEKGIAEARFFDITIVANKDGKEVEVQPQGPVRVNISYKEAIEVATEDNGEVQAVHFEEGTEDPDILDTDTDDDAEVSEVEFKAESFSVYGVVYTVDFTYDGYTFSIPGEGSILLSALAEQLNLAEKNFALENVSEVTFTNDALLKIEKQDDGDWLLTSLKAFSTEETLTIVMADGAKFIIVVTDAQNAVDVDISLYNYDDSTLLSFPSDFGETDNIYMYVWVGDSNYITEGQVTYWTCIDISEIREQNSPYHIQVDTFNNQEWGGGNVSYSSLTPEQKNNLKVRVVHSSKNINDLKLGSLKQMATGNLEQRQELDDLWGGSFNGYAMSRHQQGLISEGNMEVNFMMGNKHENDVVLTFDPAQDKGPIEAGKSYILLDATSADGNRHYYYVVKAVSDGSQDTVYLPIEGNWSSGQKFSDHWTNLKATVITPKPGKTIATGGVQPNEADYTAGYLIGDFKYTYDGYVDHDVDVENHIDRAEFKFTLQKAEYENAITPDTILGEAAEFGIVADTYRQSGHSETNYAVKNLDHNANTDVCGSGTGYMPFYVSNITGPSLDIDQTFCPIDLYIPADQDSKLHLHIQQLKDSTFTEPEELAGLPKLTEINQTHEEIESYVDGLIAYGKQSSTTMASKSTMKPVLSGNNKTVDTTQFPDGKTIYVDCTDCKDIIGTSGWIINKLPNQSIVFNIPGESVSIGEFHVNVYDGSGNKIDETGSTTDPRDDGTSVKNRKVDEIIFDHISFNAYEAKTLDLNNASALFLAPEAETVTQSNGAGWILAKGTVDSHAEWHFYRHSRNYKSKGDFSLSGQKKIMEGTTEKDYSEFSSMTFTFELYACDESGTIAEGAEALETVTAGTDGKFSFSKLKYTQDDFTDIEPDTDGKRTRTFYYVIKEDVPAGGKVGSVKYDADPVYVRVVATDDGSGNIGFAISTRTKKSDGSWSEWKVIQVGGTDTDKVYEIGDFENTFETGSLKIKKSVTENSAAPQSDAAKAVLATTYTFTIYTDEACTKPYKVNGEDKTVSITIGADCDAVTSDEVTNLPVGDYWIKETDPTNGSIPVTSKIKVTVEADKVGDAAPVAEFTNNYETVSAQVQKVWEGSNDLPPSLSVKLYADDDATDHTVTLTADNNWTSEVISGLPKYKTTADGTPALDEQGNPVAIGYHWVEGSVPSGFFLTNAVESDITNGTLTTLTNTYQEFSLTTSYIGTKTWKGASKPDSLTVELYANSVKTSHIPAWTNKDTNVWTYEFKNLPVFDANGNVIKYTAVETLTGSYSQVTSETTSEETTYVQGTPDSTSVKPCANVHITLNAHTDLGYAIIKLTGNEGFVIWTHRVPTSSELAQINSEAASEFHDFEHKRKLYFNGVGHIDTPAGTIDVEFDQDTKKLDIEFGGSSTWAWLVYGNFADAQYNPGTTKFVNQFEDTFVEVDKQWLNPDGTDADWPAGVEVNIQLTADGAEVSGKTAVLDAGQTSYKFENLPKYHDDGSTQINYSVKEVSVPGYTSTVGELTTENKITITNQKETTKATLEATKVFNDWGQAESFTFELRPVGGAPMPEGTEEGVKKATATRQQMMASFGEITYEAAGTYEYTIKEVDDGIQGITYDTSTHRVVVTVSKVGTTEKLTADVKYDSAASLTIINKYASAKAVLQATKDFGDWGKADSFTFELKPVGNAPMPEGTSGGKKTATATSANKTAAFGEIEYKEAGTYEYTITEVNDGVDGVSYDVTDHSVVVVVTKEGDNLVADVKYDGKASLTITNTYTSVKKQLEVTKDFEDWGKATEFKFDLEAVTEGAPMPAGTVDGVKTVTATESVPTALFGEIEFEKAGTYEYTITEQNGGVDGVTYDTTAHSVTVIVSKAEDETNALTAEVKYDGSDSLTITNTFTAVEEELEATKSFNDWGKATSFTFDLAAVSAETPDGRTISPVPVPTSMTATATEDEPKASFGTIKYEKAGTYTYTITERNGGADGVSYDTTSHAAVVTVSKDPETNALSASVKYDDADSLTITNTYTSTKAEIEATKAFEYWGKADSFTFELRPVGDAPMPAGTSGGKKTATATQQQKTVSFGEITFEKTGTYSYTIKEVNDGADGVTYDTTPKNVTVTVSKTSDAANALSAVVTYGEDDSLTITNTYASTSAVLQATKSINDWGTADSFTFNLKAKGDAPMPAGTEEGVKTAVATPAKPLAVFGEIEYEKAGTYEYTITEVDDGADGVTYDTSEHAVVVTVSKEDETNKLSAVVTYDGKDALVITNKYASANLELQATKAFEYWGKADSFTFELKPVDGAPMPEGTEEGKKTATATQTEQTALFGSITYKTAGTYKYTITEVDDGADGVTYDTSAHEVVVTVTKGADNKLTAEAKYDGESSLVITNTYEAAKAELEATKEFNDWGKADSFTFELKPVGNMPMPEGTTEGKKTATAIETNKTAKFGEITFEKTGTYSYTITEQNGGADGVSYDTTAHPVTVTVAKGEKNKLTATVKYGEDDSLTITNTYTSTKAKIEATKEFNDWGKAESFTFKLAAVTEGAPMPESTTATATKDVTLASFGEIVYEKAGTYNYTITEVNDGADGVTYDTTPHNVAVTVTKADDATNALTATVTYDGAKSLTITNTYEATSAELKATKEFNAWGKADSFTFELKPVGDAPMPEGTEEGKKTATATEADKTAKFGDIIFEKVGTYNYTITEVNDGVDGVSYDTTPHNAVVTVSKAEGTNKLSASVKYDGDKNDLTITNKYEAAKASLIATKSFNDWGKAESFTFDLAAKTEGAPMPENTSAVAIKDNVDAVFGEITFEKAGTYEYTITERDDGVDGVKYDTTPHKVVVTVSKADDATNKLTAEVKYDGAETLIVTNTYKSASATLQARKEFNDWGKATSFTFDLAAVTEGAPMPDNTVATATKNAPTATFGSITFEKTGTYEYTITERNSGADGVKYDTTPHKAVVKVTKDAENQMTATVTYDGKDNLIITNTFTAAKAHFEATKEFNDWGKAESFTFDLAAVTEGAPMPKGTSATATEGKAAVFGEMEFDKAGTYEYTITEQNGGADGVSYDVTPHSAKVVVSKDPKTNELSAEVSYDDEKELIITNTFTAAVAHVEATKVLEERGWFNADEFEFELAAVTEGAPMPAQTTAKATKDSQTAVFGDMEFVKAGTYKYTVTEKDGGIKGITYDTEPHGVTVTVTKAEDATNKLTATVTYDDGEKLEITNKYASEGSVVLEAGKALKGRPLGNKQFKFELMDETGSVLQTAENDADGNVTFEEISYTQDDITSWDAEKGTGTGTKKYTVKETIETKAGYTYDETVFDITVTLTDNGDGTITAEPDKGLEDLTFTNGYEAEGQIVLTAEKKLISENKLKAGQFSFELKNDKGDVLSTKKNGADGSVTFDAIKYTQDDIYEVDAETGKYSGADTKTFTYTINEVIPEGAKDNGDGTYDLNGYTYDGTVYTVKVVATDNGDGTITVKIDGAEDTKPVFTNAYKADGTLKLIAEKNYKNGTLKGNDFTFELRDADGNILQSKKNDAAGNVSFDLITYKLADVANSPYTYTVREIAGSEKNVTYDETVYTVTVTLKDNGKGKLDVTSKIDNGGKLKFVNELKKDAETSITLGGVKILEGQCLKEGMFKFELKDENGRTIGTAKNDAGGDFTFGKITYKLADLKGASKKVYKYKVSEVKGSKNNIIYDSRVYTVIVTVTDNGDGTMTAKADLARSDIKFVNKTEKKHKDKTRTGDEAPLGVLFGGLGVGVIGLAVLLEDRRKKYRKG